MHLRGIPTSNEILKSNGFKLGRMLVKLLEILADQNLYIIQLQEQINELKSQIIKIKN